MPEFAPPLALPVSVANGGTGATGPNGARVNINQGMIALVSGTNIATDASSGNVFVVTLGTNATLSNPINLVAGAGYTWIINQDSSGGRTLAYGTAFAWPGGTAPVLSTGASAVDMISAVFDGSRLRASLLNGFA